MAGRGSGRVRGNQPQQNEMAEMWRMIEDLALAVQALQRQEPVEARMEIPEGDHNPLEIDDLEDDEDVEIENPFHEAGVVHQAARGGLEERLPHAFDFGDGGVKIEEADVHEKSYAEDYLDWEANLENYFEWKPMAEFEEESKPIYDEEEEEEIEEVDVYPLLGESLVVRSEIPESQQDHLDCPISDGPYTFCQTYSGDSKGGTVKLNYGHCDISTSFHKFEDYFTGRGDIKDVRFEKEKYYSLNVPLDDGIDDDSYQFLSKPIMGKIMEVFRPGGVVLQCIANSLFNSRLDCFNLSIAEHVKHMRSYNVSLLLVSGCGYTFDPGIHEEHRACQSKLVRSRVFQTRGELMQEIHENL